jgi:hypothetical protein
MSSTNFAENKILDQLFGATALTPVANYFVGLSTSTPNETGGGITEPSSGAYARVQIANNKTTFGTASAGALTNAIAISFAESTASWGTITHIVFYDALNSGNVWFWEALPVSKSVAAYTTVYFSVGSLTISNLNAG